MDGRLVTPEAVRLDLETATVATRALARCLDLLLQGIALFLLSIALTFGVGQTGPQTRVGGITLTVVILLALLLIRIGYPVLMETRVGGTLGHLAMGLRVVTTDGATIRVRQALTRAAVGLFEIEATIGLVALLVAGIRRDGRRLGDLAAGTLVVSVRIGPGTAQALDVQVPPRLRSWVGTVDTSGLGRPERQALRQYLLRAPSLAPARRDDLAEQLADRMLPRVAARRPPGVTAHEVLVAIAASASTDAEPAGSGPGGLGGADTPGPPSPSSPSSPAPPPPPPSSTGFQPPS